MARKSTYNLTTADIASKLTQLSEFLDDLSPVMMRIAGILEADVEDAFEYERDPSTHQQWPDLQNKTKKVRARHGKWPGKMLQVSGDLISRLNSDYGSHFAAVGMQAGGNDDYLLTHLLGRPDKNIPARSFLPVDGLHPETEAKILDVLDDELAKLLK